MDLKQKIRLPYPLSRIGAYIRRRRSDRWMRRWSCFAALNNVRPMHD